MDKINDELTNLDSKNVCLHFACDLFAAMLVVYCEDEFNYFNKCTLCYNSVIKKKFIDLFKNHWIIQSKLKGTWGVMIWLDLYGRFNVEGTLFWVWISGNIQLGSKGTVSTYTVNIILQCFLFKLRSNLLFKFIYTNSRRCFTLWPLSTPSQNDWDNTLIVSVAELDGSLLYLDVFWY